MKSPTRHIKTKGLERFASSVTNWAEKWFPDSYIFAVLAIVCG